MTSITENDKKVKKTKKTKAKTSKTTKTKAKTETKTKRVIEKSRHFAFLLYPESAPKNFIDKLSTLSEPIAISPLHDRDIAEVDSDGVIRYKKEHYHCLFVANNATTADAVRKKIQRKLSKEALAQVKICDSIKNYYDYLTHESKDAIAKNKTRYSKSDIIHLNNFDIDRYTDVSKEVKDELLTTILDIIVDYRLANIVQLRRFIIDHKEFNISKAKLDMISRANASVFRLYFDAVYQEYKR